MQLDGVVTDLNCLFVFTTSLTPAATAAASAVEQAFTLSNLPKLKATDHVTVTGPGSGNSIGVLGARVNASGQLVIQFCNPTAGSLTHAAGAFVVKVAR